MTWTWVKSGRAFAPWRGLGAASECQDRRRSADAGAAGILPEGEIAQTNSPRFLLR